MYQELDQLVVKAKGGDKSSKEEIIKCLNPLIYTSIKRYYNKGSDYEDLMQQGRLIVLECIENHDNSKGAYFLGYVKTMLKYLYLNKHKERKVNSLNESIGEDGEDELIDLLESKELGLLDQYLKAEESFQLRQALSSLTERQREVIVYFYIENLSIPEISKRLNITYRTVVNTKTNALVKLRKFLEIEGVKPCE